MSSFNGCHEAHIIYYNWISSDSIKLYTDAVSTQGFVAVFCCQRCISIIPNIWHVYISAVLELYPSVADFGATASLPGEPLSIFPYGQTNRGGRRYRAHSLPFSNTSTVFRSYFGNFFPVGGNEPRQI